VEGIDYEETFAPIARYISIQTIISLAVAMGWRLHQVDEKTTFLNEEIEKEVYIEQPVGFVIHEKESHACRSKKALYGLIQAPRAWYTRIDGYGLRYVYAVSTTETDSIVDGSSRSSVASQALCRLDWSVISLCSRHDAEGDSTGAVLSYRRPDCR
jgi:hypothetical protein